MAKLLGKLVERLVPQSASSSSNSSTTTTILDLDEYREVRANAYDIKRLGEMLDRERTAILDAEELKAYRARALETLACLPEDLFRVVFDYLPFLSPFDTTVVSDTEVTYSERGRFATKTDHQTRSDTSLAVLSRVFQPPGLHRFEIGVHDMRSEMWVGLTNNPSPGWGDDFSPGERDTEHAWLYYCGARSYRHHFCCARCEQEVRAGSRQVNKEEHGFRIGDVISIELNLDMGELTVLVNNQLRWTCPHLPPRRLSVGLGPDNAWYGLAVLDRKGDKVEVLSTESGPCLTRAEKEIFSSSSSSYPSPSSSAAARRSSRRQ
eukprot:g17626.t1